MTAIFILIFFIIFPIINKEKQKAWFNGNVKVTGFVLIVCSVMDLIIMYQLFTRI